MGFLNREIVFSALLFFPHLGVSAENSLSSQKSSDIELVQFSTRDLIESSQKYIQSNRINSGINALQKRIQFNPADATAHHDLAVLYDQINDGFNSIVHTYKAKSLYKQFNDLRNLTLAERNLRLLFQKYNFHPDDFAHVEASAPLRPFPPSSQPIPEKQLPQSGTGSGFFVSKMGHVITNAHVVQNCKKVTIGDNANKQVPAELINTDRSNDLALLKLSTLEMASAESKSLIQKLGIVVVPLASKGLLRSEDVRLGEKVLVAGYPFGEFFSNTIKVTVGVVSATRGAGDDSGQFQLDAAVQPGNSGGPIYDSSGNIVGVVVSQLDKLKVAKAIGSMPENVNFGIKASTVRQFLISSGVPSKKSERTEEKSTEQLAEIAQNQALMVMCLQ